MRFRAPPAAALVAEPLDALTAVFHRPSGTTHLLAEPAPEILAALADGPLDLSGLAAALAMRFEVTGAEAALVERVEELVAAGLVERV